MDFLKELENYIEHNICNTLNFQNENSSEYVNPNCYIIHVPNSNFEKNGYNVPYIAIELENGSDDADGQTLEIRITVATYGGGYYQDGVTKTDILDNKGYIDLINAIELIKQKLLNNYTVNGAGSIRKPISYGIYDDCIYPYWYGYLRFTVDIPNNNFLERGEF